MRPCRARACMHVNLQKIPQWLYNWDMLVDVMRGCLNKKKRLLMMYFGLKGRVELQQYYCWYIFYSWIRRKFFSWYIPNSKQVLISVKTEKEFCYVFQRATNFLNKRSGWGYKLKNGLLKQFDTCQDHHEVLWWLQPDSFKSLYFRLLAAFTNKLKIGII